MIPTSLQTQKLTDGHKAMCGILVAAFLAVMVAQGKAILLVGLAAGVAVTIAIFQRPAIGAALILGLAPLDGILMVRGHSAIKLASILCVAVLALQKLIRGQGFRVDATVGYTAALLGYSAVTLFWTPIPNRGASIWFSFVLQSLLYVLLLNLVRSKNDLRIAVWGHILGGLCLGVVVITTIVANDFRRVDIANDGLGLNLAARLVALTLVLAILLYQMETVHFLRSMLIAAAILAGLGIIISLSRGSWYAALISSLAFVGTLVAKGKCRVSPVQVLSWCVAPLAVMFLLSTFFLDQHAFDKLGTRFESAVTFNDSASDRFEIWRVGWLMFLDAPLFGHGIASFAHNFPAYIGASGFSDIFYSGVEKQPHNAHVRVTTEYGLVGVTFWCGILFSVFRRVSSQFFAANVNPYALASSMALIAFLFVSSNVDAAVDRKYFWYCLSLITLFMTYWGHTGRD